MLYFDTVLRAPRSTSEVQIESTAKRLDSSIARQSMMFQTRDNLLDLSEVYSCLTFFTSTQQSLGRSLLCPPQAPSPRPVTPVP